MYLVSGIIAKLDASVTVSLRYTTCNTYYIYWKYENLIEKQPRHCFVLVAPWGSISLYFSFIEESFTSGSKTSKKKSASIANMLFKYVEHSIFFKKNGTPLCYQHITWHKLQLRTVIDRMISNALLCKCKRCINLSTFLVQSFSFSGTNFRAAK